MIWKKITIETNVEAADIVASVLFDNGIIGAEIADNQNLSDEDLKKMFVDIPLNKIDDGKAGVSFYISISEEVDDGFDKGNGLIEKSVVISKDNNNDSNLVDNSYIMSTDNIFTREEYDRIFKNIKNELEGYRDFMDMGTLNISESELDDKVFLNKWKENFKGVVIDGIEVLPSWEKKCVEDTSTKASANGNGLKIYIEPGSAFGTGKHPTTSLCVKALKDIFSSDKGINSVLDVGAGSGILSIIAMKLGAKGVLAIDVDESVENNLLENLQLNDINNVKRIDKNIKDFELGKNTNYTYGFGNILTEKWLADIVNLTKYDVIVANILAPVIISLLEKGKISSYLKPGGYIILSGIIKERENDIISAIKNDKNALSYEIYGEEEWLMFKCKKSS